MIGRVKDADHHFSGVDFVHPELVQGVQITRPEFKGFLSFVIENGTTEGGASDSGHVAVSKAGPLHCFSHFGLTCRQSLGTSSLRIQ